MFCLLVSHQNTLKDLVFTCQAPVRIYISVFLQRYFKGKEKVVPVYAVWAYGWSRGDDSTHPEPQHCTDMSVQPRSPAALPAVPLG